MATRHQPGQHNSHETTPNSGWHLQLSDELFSNTLAVLPPSLLLDPWWPCVPVLPSGMQSVFRDGARDAFLYEHPTSYFARNGYDKLEFADTPRPTLDPKKLRLKSTARKGAPKEEASKRNNMSGTDTKGEHDTRNENK